MTQIVWTLGWSDFCLKYRGSFLGYLWSFAPPFFTFLVILHVFGPILGGSIVSYPLYLFLGIIIWQHFTVTTSVCINTLFLKEHVIRRVAFPRYLLMLGVGVTNAIIFVTHVCIFILFAALMHVPLGWHDLYLIVLIIQMTLLSLGVGMFLASFTLKFRDIQHLWEVILPVFFWLTPVMYSVDITGSVASRFGSFSLPLLADWFIRYQPISLVMQNARVVLLQSGSLSWAHCSAVTLLCVLVFVVGWYTFRWRSAYFLEEY